MPRRVVFQNHSETTGESFAYARLSKAIIATDLLYEKMKEMKLDYFQEYAQELSRAKQLRLESLIGGEQPLIHWMNQIIDEIESRVSESFSWIFERHSVIHWCDEDSENAFVCSVPYWIVTILDFEGSLIHKNWSIGISESYGDLLILRGQWTETRRFSVDDWMRRSNTVSRLVDSIKEFQRIRNFRLARIGVPLPKR